MAKLPWSPSSAPNEKPAAHGCGRVLGGRIDYDENTLLERTSQSKGEVFIHTLCSSGQKDLHQAGETDCALLFAIKADPSLRALAKQSRITKKDWISSTFVLRASADAVVARASKKKQCVKALVFPSFFFASQMALAMGCKVTSNAFSVDLAVSAVTVLAPGRGDHARLNAKTRRAWLRAAFGVERLTLTKATWLTGPVRRCLKFLSTVRCALEERGKHGAARHKRCIGWTP